MCTFRCIHIKIDNTPFENCNTRRNEEAVTVNAGENRVEYSTHHLIPRMKYLRYLDKCGYIELDKAGCKSGKFRCKEIYGGPC